MAEINVLMGQEKVPEPKEVARIDTKLMPPKGIHPRHLDDTILTEDSTNILSGKSISGDDNTLTNIPASNLKIASQAAGDLLQASSSSVWARLAIGAAGTALMSNGSAASWVGSRFKIGSTTRDISTASGTQAVTGIGFAPKAVIFLAVVQSSTEASWGFDDATTHLSLRLQNTIWTNAATESIVYDDNAGKDYSGHISSMDSDGFTITWTKTGLPTGTLQVMYLAFK